jgi:hypothetical protein
MLAESSVAAFIVDHLHTDNVGDRRGADCAQCIAAPATLARRLCVN